MQTWSQRDSSVNWHPYTQMKTAPEALTIVRAQGSRLFTESGREIIDAIASWWVSIHGHAHPYINKQVADQMEQLEHVMFGGFTHPPAVQLAERLLGHLPHQARVFYSDNGSTAVEVALKMTIQSYYNQGQSRPVFIALTNGYHGDTFGAMSVSAPDLFTVPFKHNLFEVCFIEAPVPGKEDVSRLQLKQLLETREDIGGFIFEPLVLGAGGMLMYSAEVLSDMIALCHQHGVLCIADEVMTGFGRTGKFFASDHLRHKPDITCLSKGLSGGALPLGATTCTQEVFDTFWHEDKTRMFSHGHSFMANPTACAAALASLDLLEAPECFRNIERISKQNAEFAARIHEHPGVREIRRLGVILAVDFETSGKTSYYNPVRDQLYDFFISRGVLLRPLGNTVYVMPPYCISNEELSQVHQSIEAALNHFKTSES